MVLLDASISQSTLVTVLIVLAIVALIVWLIGGRRG